MKTNEVNKMEIALIICSALAVGLITAVSPLFAILFILAIFLILISLKKFEWWIYILLLLLPLGQLAKIRAFTYDIKLVPVFLSDVLIFFLFFGWILKKLINKEKFYKFPLLTQVFAFIVMASLSLLYGIFRFDLSMGEALTSGLYLVRWIGYASLFYIIADVIKSKKDLYLLFKFALFSGIAVAVVGFLQLIFLPHMSTIIALLEPYRAFGFDPHRYRMVSTFLDPNMLGGFLAVFLFVFAGLAYHSRTNTKKLTFLAFSLVFLVAIALTFSRGTYLAVFFGFLVFSVFKRKGVTLLVLISVLLILALFSPFQERIVSFLDHPGGHEVDLLFVTLRVDLSAYSRIISWKNGFEVLRHNFIVGTGYNTYYYASEQYGVERRGSATAFGIDSTLLLILITTGLVGFLLYLNIIFHIFKLMLILEKSFTDLRLKGLALGIFLSYAALIVHSTFTNSFIYLQIMEITWIMVGIALAGNKIQNMEKAQLKS